jgi:hypothetical protein
MTRFVLSNMRSPRGSTLEPSFWISGLEDIVIAEKSFRGFRTCLHVGSRCRPNWWGWHLRLADYKTVSGLFAIDVTTHGANVVIAAEAIARSGSASIRIQ